MMLCRCARAVGFPRIGTGGVLGREAQNGSRLRDVRCLPPREAGIVELHTHGACRAEMNAFERWAESHKRELEVPKPRHDKTKTNSQQGELAIRDPSWALEALNSQGASITPGLDDPQKDEVSSFDDWAQSHERNFWAPKSTDAKDGKYGNKDGKDSNTYHSLDLTIISGLDHARTPKPEGRGPRHAVPLGSRELVPPATRQRGRTGRRHREQGTEAQKQTEDPTGSPRAFLSLPTLPKPTHVPFTTRYWTDRAQGAGRPMSSDTNLPLVSEAPTEEEMHMATRRLLRADVKDGALELSFGRDASSPLSRVHLSLLWLRDTCPCPVCVDPHSGQKNFSTCGLPDDPQAHSVCVLEDGSLEVTWADEMFDGRTPHVSVYPHKTVKTWLRRDGSACPVEMPKHRILWNSSNYETLLPRCVVNFEDWIKGGAGFWNAVAMLAKTGLVVVTGVVPSERGVEHVARKIGELQQTFYGRTWDVRSKPEAENVAYTSQFLGLHQDLMYHVPPPKLQFLHCLDNSCDGGESMFSDGLRAAMSLKITNPSSYRLLSKVRVNFHYTKDPHQHFSTLPVIDHNHNISWAPQFQAPFDRRQGTFDLDGDENLALDGDRDLVMWKRAATDWEKTISAPENLVEFRMSPGDCVVFDNRRVLHGRRQFNLATGSRWLKGCYVSDQTFQACLGRMPEGVMCRVPMSPSALNLAYESELRQARALVDECPVSGDETCSVRVDDDGANMGQGVQANTGSI